MLFFKSKKKDQTKKKKLNAKKKKKDRKKGKAMPLLSLDIGSSAIKLMQGKQKKDRLEITDFEIVELEDGIIHDGLILNAEKIEQILKAIVKKHKIKNIVLTIESTELIQREIVLPSVNDSEILGLLKYEMIQYLPIDIGSYSIQYRVIEEFTDNNNSQQLKLSVYAMPIHIARSYMDLLTKLKLNPIALDIHSNALRKLLDLESVFNDRFLDKNVVMIDMGHKIFNIQFFVQGVFVFNRVTEIGGNMINEMMKNVLDKKNTEIELLKKQYLSSNSMLSIYQKYCYISKEELTESEDIIFYKTIEVLESWLRTIDSIIKYYNFQPIGRTHPIQTIYLYGGCSAIKDIDSYFENRLKIPVEKLTHLNCLDNKCPSISDIEMYHNAIGSLIRNN